MPKTRVYELAKELEIDAKDLIPRLEKLGIAVKSHSSTLENEEVERVRREFTLGERDKIIEKRVRSTVIRRRAIRQPEEKKVPKEEEKAEETLAHPEGKEILPEEKVAPAAGEIKLEEAEPKPAEPEEQEPVAPHPEEPAVKEAEAEAKTEAKELSVEKERERMPETELQEAPATKEELPATEVREAEKKAEAIAEPESSVKEEPSVKSRPVQDQEAKAEKPTKEQKLPAAKQQKTQEETEEAIKKKRKPISIVIEDVPARRKAFIKQIVEKKERRGKHEREAEAVKSWKEEKKQIISSQKMKKTEITTPKAIKRRIKMDDAIRVGDLAKKMGVKTNDVISKLISLGMMVTINQSIDADVASLVAGEFGYQIELVNVDYEEAVPKAEAIPEKLRPRAPVVTVMGHVDHGKTSLLDAIRKTSVTEDETGGITQAIGAYHVRLNDRDIVFLDTPGHEAFTTMRARGARVTDIVVLVVAADDGVMDQTIEAINHSKAAGVPIIVAVNKIDKPGADPGRIKQQLSEYGLVPEEWGGETIFAEVSAKQKVGIEELLELILLQADIMDLKADPDRPAKGIIIEAKLDKGRGPVATVIIQEGTLNEGDAFVSKTEYGKVRAMMDDKGMRVPAAGPSMPVEVIGFSKVPAAGVDFVSVEDEKKARNIGEYWFRKERERKLSTTSKITLEQLYERIKEGAKELKIIIKADVQGSVEALSEALLKIASEDINLNILHASTGAITETDVMLASASDAVIIGFRIRPDARIMDLAEKEGVDLKFYGVIYEAIAEVKAAMEGLLEPVMEEVHEGFAEARELFRVPKIGVVAGSYVTDGKLVRNSYLRLIRDGAIVYEGKFLSLKRFKDDVKEVQAGFECGIGIEGYDDIKAGDVIESYTKKRIERTL
ncbi:MAG: translation initiation factor IF-2 [Syntrophales bacterium]|jgi:translation initiation factor IF-2|nr:translation initiation factor IF-2 [Syntrophales bacterium]MDY0043331.1 translation initiation factor IF-2 [Syntrophales bacterium]